MYLKPREIATRMRVAPMTVYLLIHTGELKSVQIGRSYRVLEEDLEAYLSREVADDDQGVRPDPS